MLLHTISDDTIVSSKNLRGYGKYVSCEPIMDSQVNNKQSNHEAKIYSCNQCSYNAKKKDHLKTHIQAKHEYLRFLCNVCDYTFSGEKNLKRHNKQRHKEFMYNCDQCS